MRSTSTKILAAVVPALALALALAGCGGGGTEPSVASAAQAPPASAAAAASGPADPIAQYVESRRAWVKCLREAGMEVPDPDAKGRVALSGTDKTDPTVMAAQQKCRNLSVAIPDGLEEKPTFTAEEIQYRRNYAKCMRQYGVTNFADPDATGNWPDTEGQEPVGDSLKAQVICQPTQTGGAPDPNATPKPAQG
jgi:hypothetical protein